MTEQDARKYWRYNYTTDEYRRLARKWDEIKDKLHQPENIDTNLELRKVEALEKIAYLLGQIAEEGILTYDGKKYFNSKKGEE